MPAIVYTEAKKTPIIQAFTQISSLLTDIYINSPSLSPVEVIHFMELEKDAVEESKTNYPSTYRKDSNKGCTRRC